MFNFSLLQIFGFPFNFQIGFPARGAPSPTPRVARCESPSASMRLRPPRRSAVRTARARGSAPSAPPRGPSPSRRSALWSWRSRPSGLQIRICSKLRFEVIWKSTYLEISKYHESPYPWKLRESSVKVAALWENPENILSKFSKNSAKFWQMLKTFVKKQQNIKQFLTKIWD